MLSKLKRLWCQVFGCRADDCVVGTHSLYVFCERCERYTAIPFPPLQRQKRG